MQVKFYAATCIDKICNHDWEGEIKDKGSKVIIRVIPDVTIGDYYVGGTITYQDINDSTIELLIDKAKYYAFKVDDIDAVQSDIPVMNKTTGDAGEQMKIKVEQVVFSTVYAQANASNYLSDDGTASSFTANGVVITKADVLDYIVDSGTKLDEQNVPDTGRWGVLPPWVCGMIKKSDLANASISGDGQSIRRNGRIGEIDRYELFRSNNLYTASSVYACLFGTSHAICFASQFVKTETLRLQNTFGDAVRGLKVFGFKVTKDEALVVAYWKRQ